MGWGDGFLSAWDEASSAARDVAAAIATGARTAANDTVAVVQSAVREAHAIAQTAERTADQSVQAVSTFAGAVAEKTAEAAAWAVEEGERATAWAAEKGKQAVKTTAKAVAKCYDQAKRRFSLVSAATATAACAGEDWTVGLVGMGLAAGLTKPGISNLLRPLLKLGGNSTPKNDGDVLGAGCLPEGTSNPNGVMPPGCRQLPGTLPKISYVNGINTAYAQPGQKDLFSGGICKTMLEIAKTTCSEVTGVYNATQGFGKDLDECLDNIAKDGDSPSVVPLRNMMVQAAQSGRRMTLFAHSQGGLITQEAVAQAKQQLMKGDHLTSAEAEQRLGVVSIDSFGTAIMGWPKGPHYQRFTNTADPVPPIIVGAQTSYPIATWKDSANADANYVFTSPHLNPFDSHSMDDTYLPEFAAVKGAPRCVCKAA
jgi:hypothetical protein